MYVHMELFSKAVVDVEPFEIDDHLFNIIFFAIRIHVLLQIMTSVFGGYCVPQDQVSGCTIYINFILFTRACLVVL